jgi:hypothetical protein
LLAGERRQVILRAGEGSQRETRFGGEDFTMADNDPNAPRNEEAERLKAYQRVRDLLRRRLMIYEAVQGITDDNRKMLINKVLRKVNSSLTVS